MAAKKNLRGAKSLLFIARRMYQEIKFFFYFLSTTHEAEKQIISLLDKRREQKYKNVAAGGSVRFFFKSTNEPISVQLSSLHYICEFHRIFHSQMNEAPMDLEMKYCACIFN